MRSPSGEQPPLLDNSLKTSSLLESFGKNMGLYNAKIKIYKDGTTNEIYSDKCIFGDKLSYESDSKEQNLELKFGYDSKVYRCDSRNIDTQYNRMHDCYRMEFECEQEELKEKRKKERIDNLKRVKEKVYDIIYQNEWAYFMTITLREDDSYDRRDPKEVYKLLRTWLSNQVQRKGLQYILIPEYHKKGGIHCHALVNDVLPMVYSGKRAVGKKAWNDTDLLKRGININAYKPVFNVVNWQYGWSTAIPLDGAPGQIANYMTKYITKDLKKIFGKYYCSSKNIQRNCEIQYTNVDYSAVCAKEYQPILGTHMKYKRQLVEYNKEKEQQWETPPTVTLPPFSPTSDKDTKQ